MVTEMYQPHRLVIVFQVGVVAIEIFADIIIQLCLAFQYGIGQQYACKCFANRADFKNGIGFRKLTFSFFYFAIIVKNTMNKVLRG